MRDTCGRTVSYLRLSVTDRCNCRCAYCMPEHGVPMLSHDDILSFEELREMVGAAASLGVRKLRITGGEPLARRGIVGLVRMLSGVEGIEELAMTTNACALAALAPALREAGLDRLNVSLDSLDEGRYARITRCGRLEDVLGGLASARSAGFTNTKVNAVLIGGVNECDIRPLAELARAGGDGPLGVSSVRFIELMPMGECAAWPRERFVSVDKVLEVMGELVPVGPDGVAALYAAPGWKGTVGLIRPMSHKFCSGCARLRITADGMLKPCLHSGEEIALRGLHGDELLDALRLGISHKPLEHHMSAILGRASESARAMNEIGG